MEPIEPISFFEENIVFEAPSETRRGVFDKNDFLSAVEQPTILGIKIRIGNKPIVRNLKKLIEISHQQLPAELQLLFERSDIYIVTHAIGAIQITGNATLSELQFNASIDDLDAATIDLLPDTEFKTVLSVNGNYEAAVKAGGNFSAKVPEELKHALSGSSVSLGGDIDLHLSSSTQFVGKITANIKFPIIIASGKASSYCSWVIKRDKDPLLGDQLLLQTLTVPKGSNSMTYNIKVTAKVKHGFFKTDSVDTSTVIIPIILNP